MGRGDRDRDGRDLGVVAALQSAGASAIATRPAAAFTAPATRHPPPAARRSPPAVQSSTLSIICRIRPPRRWSCSPLAAFAVLHTRAIASAVRPSESAIHRHCHRVRPPHHAVHTTRPRVCRLALAAFAVLHTRAIASRCSSVRSAIHRHCHRVRPPHHAVHTTRPRVRRLRPPRSSSSRRAITPVVQGNVSLRLLSTPIAPIAPARPPSAPARSSSSHRAITPIVQANMSTRSGCPRPSRQRVRRSPPTPRISRSCHSVLTSIVPAVAFSVPATEQLRRHPCHCVRRPCRRTHASAVHLPSSSLPATARPPRYRVRATAIAFAVPAAAPSRRLLTVTASSRPSLPRAARCRPGGLTSRAALVVEPVNASPRRRASRPMASL